MPTNGFRPKVKGTATGRNMPSPRHSRNQDEAVHPPQRLQLTKVFRTRFDWNMYAIHNTDERSTLG